MGIKYVFSVLGILCVPTLLAVQTDWRPIDPLPVTTLSFQSHIPPPHDECTLYKVILDQDTLQQYIQYKTQIPDLKEFTLCTWHKFYNHTHDQPLFSYSSHGRPKEIYSWVANTEKSSYYVLAVRGQTIYRLNYPIRLHRWYHSCQSWNGRTGEWQIWINAERIGRGFHNLLVGKPIKGGGVAVSGQEQRRYDTGFDSFFRPSSLQGEILLVQLYKAALTAGKAYTNHKHHHVHHFHHDDSPGVDDPEGPGGFGEQQPAEVENQGTEFPFIRNGQLIPTLPVRELSAFRAQEDVLKQQSDDLSNIGGNSQLNILSSALLGRGTNPYSLQSTRLFKREQSKRLGNSGKRLVRIKKSDNSEEAQSEDLEITTHTTISKTEVKGNRTLSEHNSQMKIKTANANHNNDKAVSKRETETKAEPDEKVHKKKRTIQLTDPFGYIPGIDLSGLFSGDGYILGGGGLKFDDTENNAEHPFEDENKQMEPAEWEVRSIMAVCSGCSEDPFRKANILSWRETPKKLYSGALYVPAIPQCHRF